MIIIIKHGFFFHFNRKQNEMIVKNNLLNYFRLLLEFYALIKLFIKVVVYILYFLIFIIDFPSSRLELEAVADIFDFDKDGFIDYKEFLATLKQNAVSLSFATW
jgi:hypothetical protein